MAQGMTVPTGTKLLAAISDKERSPGITFIALSRNMDVNELLIGNAISLERLTTEITRSEAFKSRRREDERLTQLQQETIALYLL